MNAYIHPGFILVWDESDTESWWDDQLYPCVDNHMTTWSHSDVILEWDIYPLTVIPLYWVKAGCSDDRIPYRYWFVIRRERWQTFLHLFFLSLKFHKVILYEFFEVFFVEAFLILSESSLYSLLLSSVQISVEIIDSLF